MEQSKANVKTKKLPLATVAEKWNLRTRTIVGCIAILAFLLAIYISGLCITDQMLKPNFMEKNLPPTLHHLFGTDWLGRDMFYRTIKGLSTSMTVGIIASLFSAVLATILGVVAASGSKWLDSLISWFIDLTMGIPHMVLLILISFALGGGMKGIMVGIIVTHWTGLARLVRGEVLKLRSQEYIQLARNLGKNNYWIMFHHLLPHMLPVFVVGVVLLFPHAILHESAISFLGFGLSPEQPAIGIILAESMRYLTSGIWWLAVIPGTFLVLIVFMFDKLGENLKKILDPYDSQS